MSAINMLPPSLDQWTYDTVVDLVNRHAYEPGRFDFKEVLRVRGDSNSVQTYRSGLQRAIGALANTDGGFLIFGVRDQKHGGSPESRVVGIALDGDLRKELGDIASGLQPNVFFEAVPTPIRLPTDVGQGVYVVYVPRSPLRPHMVTGDHRFYRRGEGGTNDPMDYYQVRDQVMVSEEKLRKLALLRLQIAQFLRIVEKMEPTMDIFSSYRFDTTAFGSLVADVISLIPHATRLPERLLEVPLFANRINVVLDRTIYGSTGRDLARHELQARLYDVRSGCEFCAQELDALFGDVLPSKSVSQLP